MIVRPNRLPRLQFTYGQVTHPHRQWRGLSDSSMHAILGHRQTNVILLTTPPRYGTRHLFRTVGRKEMDRPRARADTTSPFRPFRPEPNFDWYRPNAAQRLVLVNFLIATTWRYKGPAGSIRPPFVPGVQETFGVAST